MKKLLLFTSIFLLATSSCKHTPGNEREISTDFIPLIKKYYGEELVKEGLSIDSIVVYSIEEMTEKKDSIYLLYKLNSALREGLKIASEDSAKISESLKSSKLYMKIDADIADIELKDASRNQKKLQGLIDGIKMFQGKAKHLSDTIRSGSLDSVTSTGHMVTFKIIARDTRNVGKDIDSLKLVFDSNKRIVSPTYF